MSFFGERDSPKPPTVDIHDEKEKQEILKHLKAQQQPHVYKRLMILKMRAVNGKGSREIAETVGLCVTSVNRILLRYK